MSLFSHKKDGDKEEKASKDAGSHSNTIIKQEKTQEEKKDNKAKPSMKNLYESSSGSKSTGKKSSVAKTSNYNESYRTLIKPLITEKAAKFNSENKYVFAVAPKANKIMIGHAVEAIYGVKPARINVVSVKGKKVRTGRTLGKRKDWKKAIVTLPQGKSIQIYEGV